ncbi:hypothetical protein [Mesoplasma melaleucae]|uniref:Uncharacterized protein n=1 Tax=Mesoplasma melaleucae TaxID=81459 RepID=A0A2K8NVX7_9MOLU|nr:hypothetical protein [Mesoplasma melaleucae]ATZ17995.1 hypothetical protein EMELA_v1c04510 [Mesoplasma melaleucae]
MEIKELQKIVIKNDYILLKESTEKKYYIFRKLDKQIKNLKDSKNIIVKEDEEVTYHSAVIFEEQQYESLKVNQKIDESFMLNLFDFISSKKWSINEMLCYINLKNDFTK